MTTTPRGARLVASKNPTSTPTVSASPAPSAPPADFEALDDSRVLALATRVRDGVALTDAQRAYLHGAGSNAPAPDGLAQDLGLVGGDMRALARRILDCDVARRGLLDFARDLATGCMLMDEASRPIFLSSLRRLRGAVPAELSKALDLAPAASFGNVAERLGERMSPKREGAR